MTTRSNIKIAFEQARAHLLSERTEVGYWEGELSTSALSTATAIVALGSVDEGRYREHLDRASRWLREHQNPDGGWGDTIRSFSNISTTLLAWSALRRFAPEASAVNISRARDWIRDYVGSLDPDQIAETVKARYGKDRTFSVPILMLCAICGTLGERGWKRVLRLPFELAALPREWFATMRLPVVSYALPALIAIGYARYCEAKPGGKRWHPLWPKVSALLTKIQPASGGFLEAAPLTSFVAMALVAAGEREHPVVEKAVAFLEETVREDGSWPIDTNLATWATTLATKALGGDFDSNERISDWLLNQQYREVHPFTNSPPGGWAWTDLSGGVPDADDTPGALLALRFLAAQSSEEIPQEWIEAARSAVIWLLDLQNRDGGIPTFCRGWGALPFDRSSPDLTAHALRAWDAWKTHFNATLVERIELAEEKGRRYLLRNQARDGSWVPLWFGNQHRLRDEANPTYGTAMVLRAFEQSDGDESIDRAVKWLTKAQNEDGGWGSLRGETPSSIEETSLAISALVNRTEARDSVDRGVDWLVRKTEGGTRFEAAPIGFYFAKLWYFERSYPLIWATEALRLYIEETEKVVNSSIDRRF
ncbi:MAG: prenyltransferase/squalene oxidase repeat-containing protein [Verrucomicrobiota bacterium]